MNYYIIKSKIVGFENVLNTEDHPYQMLTEEQADFYIANPTASKQEVLNVAMNAPYVPTLQDMKNTKLSIADTDFLLLLEDGYYDPIEDITLAILDEDRTAFTQLLSMVHLADELNMSPTSVPINDKERIQRMIDILPLKGLLLRYGFHYQTVWATYSAKLTAIKNAISIEDLELI